MTHGKSYFVKAEISQTRPYMQRSTFRHKAHRIYAFSILTK